mmetsp:Transcript_5343/g.8177  ORF Transcript_5343/g.8177 Transcript_5343/m.8177 type:complete len:297 (+) Transcript_5343:85-975(+)
MLRHFSSATRRLQSKVKHSSALSRYLSTTPPPPEAQAQAAPQATPSHPFSLTKEIAVGIQDATALFINHGVGMQKLQMIAKEAGNTETLVNRWQRMMEAYLGTQVHVLAGLGYQPNENGLHMYNQHVGMFMQNADPETQEMLRTSTRDLWRTVLSTAFNISISEIASSEMDIVKARETMHKVSQKMQSPEILEMIALKCGKIESTGNAGMDMAMKHQIVQDTLVHQVYLGGEPTLVEECGFENGEKGYVFMQCVMAEHQNDPLVSQYVGASMMQLLKSAGIGMEEIEAAANAARSS